MCIIIHKPESKTVDLETLARCFEANSHGAGYMFIEEDRVWGNKGYMTFDELEASLKENGLMENDQLVRDLAITLHFRKATHGGISPGNCHPFPVTNKVSLLKARYWEAPIGVAHNGVIRDIYCRPEMSDTQEFIAQVLSTPAVHENLDDGGVQMAIALATRGSRLFILKSDGTHIRTGEWVEEKGILYSNLSYMPKARREQVQDWVLTGDKSKLLPGKKSYPYSWIPRGKGGG